MLKFSFTGRGKERFHADARGVAAVEFALIAGTLIMLFLGMCDVVPAWLTYTHAATAASTAADLAGEYSEMQTSDMATVYIAAEDVMAPFPSSSQLLRITSVFTDGHGNAKVQWSCGQGSLPAYTALSTVTSTPTGTPVSSFIAVNSSTAANTSYILTEIKYPYTAPTQFVLKSVINLSSVAFYLPRSSAYVGFPWDGISSDAPTVPTAATKASSVTLSNGAVCSYAQ